MNRKKSLLLIVFLLIQTIAIYAQPKQMHAVLTSPDYNHDDSTGLSFLIGEGMAALDIKDGLIAQAWNQNNIKVLRTIFATKANIKDAIIAMPKLSNTMNFFFFGGHGSSNGIYTHNAVISRVFAGGRWWQTTNIQWISPSELQSYFGSFNTYCAFIEACYSGVFKEQMSKGVIFTSSSSSELSAGPPSGGVGYFTSKLQEGMQFANFPIGSLTAQTLFNYAAPLTTSNALTYSGITQTPQMRDNYGSPLLITIPAYDVTLENKFVGLSNRGTMSVDGQATTLPVNTLRKYYGTNVELIAQNQTITGIEYTFSRWENNSTSYTRTLSVTTAVNPQAYFTGKPSIANRNQQITSSIGQLITLVWNANPNQYVTEYRVYRKIGHNGTPSLLTTTSNTTFTDPDYTMTGNSEDTYLMYDVRPYYSLEQTESNPYFQSAAFGRIELSYSEDKLIASIANEMPAEYSITNYPNPFNPTTTINYQLPENGFVTIKVYDLLGKEIASLVNENKSAGYYKVEFNASKLTSGVYIYTINANNFIQSKKILLMK